MNESILTALFAALDTAAMERGGDGRFRMVGAIPEWFLYFHPEAASKQNGLKVEAAFPFLENFLIDAEHFWEAQHTDRIESGVWIETDPSGKEYALEATALSMESRKILLIRWLGAAYEEKQSILQKAREGHLAHQRLIRLQQALRESFEQIKQAEQEWRSTADSLSEIVCLLDVQGCIMRANRTVEGWNLGQVADVQGHDIHEVLHPGCTGAACYLENFWRQAREKLNQGKSAECESDDRRLNRYLRIQVRPIRAQREEADKGTNSFAVVVVQDLTEQKRAEEMKAEVIRLCTALGKEYAFENIVGKSEEMQGVYALIQQATESDITVLIQGESGTGKELVAKAIHFNSARKTHPFITVNCAAIPETLIESELFGHERGAFTGAVMRRIGKFEQANGGTIFLDEIGEMQPSLQARLLRVLQEREIQRVGGVANLPIDIRVIAATNKDLGTAVKSGVFREDLFYRIAVFPIVIPPLRERRRDIHPLAEHFLKRHAEKARKSMTAISAEALQLLMNYDWPGNVRELENVIQRAVLLETSTVLKADNPALREIRQSDLSIPPNHPLVPAQILPLEVVEKQTLIRALKVTDHNITRAAQALGIDRTTLHRKLKKYRLQKR